MKSRLFLLGLLALPSTVPAQIARLKFMSDPGDFIGAGFTKDVVYTPSQSFFFDAQVRRTVDSQPAELLFSMERQDDPFTFTQLFFGTDGLGIPMQPGVYLDAQRADFVEPGHPGLDISFGFRGSNTVTGSFVVREFDWNDMGIQRFVADFEQHSEGGIPAMRGTFEYSSTSLLTPVPEPATYSIMGGLIALGTIVMRRGRRIRQS